MKTFSLLLLLSMITSCNIHKTTLKELKSTKSNYQMSYDAVRRGSIVSINTDGSIAKILSEVQPDVAISQTMETTSKLAAKLAKGEEFSAEQITKITESLTTLGERTAAVNILRDALYRLEEHCINFPDHCKTSDYWLRYDKVVDAVTNLQSQITQQKKEDVEKEKTKVKQLDTEKEILLLKQSLQN